MKNILISVWFLSKFFLFFSFLHFNSRRARCDKIFFTLTYHLFNWRKSRLHVLFFVVHIRETSHGMSVYSKRTQSTHTTCNLPQTRAHSLTCTRSLSIRHTTIYTLWAMWACSLYIHIFCVWEFYICSTLFVAGNLIHSLSLSHTLRFSHSKYTRWSF